MECYEKAATGHQRQSSFWHAAKLLEKAGDAARDAREFPAVEDYYNRSAELYASQGRPATAAEALNRGARTMEDVHQQAAVTMYSKALGWIEDSGKDALAGDIYRQAINYFVKTKNWDNAVAALLKFAVSLDNLQATSSQAKAYLGTIVVCLARGDVSQGWSIYQDALGIDAFSRSDEAFAADSLFEAYRTASVEAIQGAVKGHRCFLNLENQLARLAKGLPNGGGGEIDLKKMAEKLGVLGLVGGVAVDEEEDLT
jgi:gamma-soluble NSF attachment protein